MVKLLQSTANSKDYVDHFIKLYRLVDIVIELIAADSGVTSESKFRVFTTEVERLLLQSNIKSERAEPRNHSRGTAVIERSIRMIKELTRLAVVYVLTNPNFESFGFTRINVLKLWGELFNWSVAVINMKPALDKPSITGYESFTGRKPNMHNIRLLPIFSVVLLHVDDHSNSGAYQNLRKQVFLKGL